MNRRESLWRYYEEHASHARHHETQRSNQAHLFFGVTGAAIAAVAALRLDVATLPILLFLYLIGIQFERIISKSYERNRFHTSIMAKIRSEIDSAYDLGNTKSLSTLRSEGEHAHEETHDHDVIDMGLNEQWIGLVRATRLFALILFLIVAVVHFLEHHQPFVAYMTRFSSVTFGCV